MAEERVGKAVMELVLDDSQYKLVLANVDKSAKQTADNVKNISQLISADAFISFGRKAVEALGLVTSTLVDLGERGAAVDDISSSFNTLSESVGTTGQAMLGQLRQGVVGTMSDFDLMRLANTALGAGLIHSAEDMGTLSAGARALAKATGGTTAEAFDTLTGAIASGRTATLKQIGLFVDAKVATEAFAKAHGTTADKLTDAGRAQALAEASLAALRDRMKQIVPDAADFGEKLDQVKVTLTNFRDELAQAVAKSPVLAAGLDAIGTAVKGAFGSNQQTAISTALHLIEGFAIGITTMAQGTITGVGVAVQAWYVLKAALIAVETAVAGVAYANVAAVAGLVDMAAKVPGASAVIGGLKLTVDNLRDGLKGATGSLAAQTAEALKGAAGQSEFQGALDKAYASVTGVKTAMQAAQGAQRAMGEESKRTSTTVAQAALTMDTAVKAHVASILATLKPYIEKVRADNSAMWSAVLADGSRALSGIRTAAASSYGQVVLAAKDAGFKTRAELEATAQKAQATYQQMLASGLFTEGELLRAKDAAEKAKQDLDGKTASNKEHLDEMLASSASSILRSMFGKSKGAAIAAAIIDTYAAVAKALSAYPWPLNLVPAAAALAAGMAQVNQIRSTNPEGFATGTPGLDFSDFGHSTMTVLHGREAVVPKGSGHMLAAEIAAAMPAGNGGGLSDEAAALLRGLGQKLDDLPRRLARSMKTAMVMAG